MSDEDASASSAAAIAHRVGLGESSGSDNESDGGAGSVDINDGDRLARPEFRDDLDDVDDEGDAADDDDAADDFGAQAEELDEEVVDELDIQQRERQYFSEEEDDDEGEDLAENAEMDYRRMETLDRYDPELLDDRRYEDMEMDTRRLVEEELNRRDAREGRVAQVFQEDQEMERDDAHRRRFRRDDGSERGLLSEQQQQELEDEEIINLEHFDVPLREWIATERPRNEIKRRFKHFLNTFADRSGRLVYHEKIVEMAQRNEQSLELAIGDVIQRMSMLAAWLVEAPTDMLAILSEVARDVVRALFPYYDAIHDEVFVRIRDLPGTEHLRDLRTAHLNFLIKVSGVVTRRTSVFPQLKLVKVNCPGCGAVLGPFAQQSSQAHELKLNACPECQHRGPFAVNAEQTVYRNYQKLTLQESPGSVPPGRVPRSKDVVLVGDLIDAARPGDEVAITGVYTNTPDPTLNLRDGFPVFRTVIEANHVERRADALGRQVLTAEDKRAILALSKHPGIAQVLVNSIAPSIYGHAHVKTGLALALFGGQPKFIKSSRVRGDLNVLLVGDPGTAKSQFLRFCEATAPRAVYATGKGASAVGLTAGVARDPFTKEWNVELTDPILQRFDVLCVLQDRVDPVDDARLADFVVASHMRSNPRKAPGGGGGGGDGADGADAGAGGTGGEAAGEDASESDDALAEKTRQALHVGDASGSSSSSTAGLTIPQELLRKYILYARTYVKPAMASDVDTRKVETFYAQLRRASQHTGAVPIAVRHLESLFRMAEAHARMHLRESVTNDDVDVAIRVLTESLCAAQKFAFQRQWRRLFRPYLTYRQDNNVLLLHVLHELFQAAHAYHQLRLQTHAGASASTGAAAAAAKKQQQQQQLGGGSAATLSVLGADLLAKAKAVGIYDLSGFFGSPAFAAHGFRYDDATHAILKDI
ncbi:hypothetical protein PybrP1_005482 [[Pythium] brassicae (nom. inval.)]|nr:hypothetical protein PybrP1_005482 [[Pythium] brassicae (nom. inval.)]